MMMSSPSQSCSQSIGLSEGIELELTRCRRLIWRVKLAEGALMGCFGGAVSFLIAFGLDRVGDTPSEVRWMLLLAGSLGGLVGFPLKCHRWVWRCRRLDQVARVVRLRYPRFGDQLLGIVELARAPVSNAKSRRLIQAAIRQVGDELAMRDLGQAVPRPRHWHWAWAAGVPGLLIVAIFLVVPLAGRNTLARWAMPWSHLDRYTFAQLESTPATRVVPYAEPFSVNVQLRPTSPWRPDRAEGQFETQAPMTADRTGLGYVFAVAPQTRRGELLISVGDSERRLQIEPKSRPALTDLLAHVSLPGYLRRPERVEEDARGGRLSWVRGSRVRFQAQANRPLAAASFNGVALPVAGASFETKPLVLETSLDGELWWRDRFGLEARDPLRFRLEVRSDAAPTIHITGGDQDRMILSTATLTLTLLARDDFGLREVGLEWEGIADSRLSADPARGEKVVAAGGPRAEQLRVTATFSPEREAIVSQSLRLRAYAIDYHPDRSRRYSAPVVVHVLTPADHFQWLSEQMNQWTRAAREVYEQELQLHQINEALLQLPPDGLAEPALRERVQAQAAAERTNAARLGRVVGVGKGLLREAIKNDGFAAGRLEEWSELLRTLEEIAKTRMPSVASSLAEAADASGEGRQTHDQAAVDESKPASLGASEGTSKAEGSESSKPDREGMESTTSLQSGGGSLREDPNARSQEEVAKPSPPTEGSPGQSAANPTPLVGEVESGFNTGDKGSDSAQVKGGLGMPMTALKGGKPEGEESQAVSMGTLVLQAVTEQRALIDAFAGLAERVKALLQGVERSTFVKRLKAASRRQMDLAVQLNDLDGFGLSDEAARTGAEREVLGRRQVIESELIQTLSEDLDAYAERRPGAAFSRVLKEMRVADVVAEVRAVAAIMDENRIGQSAIASEFWADSLDRWAEQLVGPAIAEIAPTEAFIDQPNLTPEMVLEVLQIIEGEIKLREEVRELDRSKAALQEGAYQASGLELSGAQDEWARRTRGLVREIDSLPRRNDPLIQQQSLKLSEAIVVMDEVIERLAQPDTGPVTVAALSEIIEILVETTRVPNATKVTPSAPSSMPALWLMGRGDDESLSQIDVRAPGQATGKAGRRLPEEFRQGLDAYLNALEQNRR